ncbi:hypothetical protein BC343_15085 [Mucilaginibacter pedocola]|uniref:Uncharacterized protein n=1 Tax=Mucilaginibacter pedocola TaxID=1792845 RepID=A0A1S9P987_9SPHI|nr:hypothetical protein BC343_15085 [Mucilaginibacter pedocola]
MLDSSSIVISVSALLATFYQAYQQRVHNVKSVKPLPQIDCTDRGRILFVRVQNNGVGPLIIQKLTFYKNGQAYYNIQDSLEINPKSYDGIPITPTTHKVLIPGRYLDVFSKEFDESYTDEQMIFYRKQLSLLHLKVEGRDVYDNRVVIERNLHWFARHIKND